MLQLMVLLFSLAGTLSKLAAGVLSKEGWLDFSFLALVAAIYLILAVYAFFWQKILNKVELSIAYISKATSLFWTLVWSILFFKETVSWENVLGIGIIIIGILIVSFDKNRASEIENNQEVS